LWAVEGELRRLVIGEVGLPAILVRWQPHLAALGALRHQSDSLGAHVSDLRGKAAKFCLSPAAFLCTY
jgi:hypothetical protein